MAVTGVEFSVEWVGVLGGRAIVWARPVASADFHLDGAALFGGRRVLELDMPRALDSAGRVRLDLFAFWLEDGGPTFEVGQRVLLERAPGSDGGHQVPSTVE